MGDGVKINVLTTVSKGLFNAKICAEFQTFHHRDGMRILGLEERRHMLIKYQEILETDVTPFTKAEDEERTASTTA